MKLNDNQIQEVIKKINEISHGDITCPVCGQKHWSINDVVIENREFQKGNLVIGGQSAIVPFVTLTCANCGNTIFLNALKLGVIDRNDPSENLENHGR